MVRYSSHVTLALTDEKLLKAHKHKMSGKLSIEEEVKNVHKHMGTVVKMMQNLKCSVEMLEKKIGEPRN